MLQNVDTSVWGWIKTSVYAAAVIIVNYIGKFFTYIEVENMLVVTLTVIMMFDWVTGILKARSLNIKITSKKSNKGVLEKAVLLSVPLAIAFAAKVIDIPLGVTVKGLFSILIVAELYSAIGNCYCIYTKEDIKEYDAVTAIMKWLRTSLSKVLKNFMTEEGKA